MTETSDKERIEDLRHKFYEAFPPTDNEYVSACFVDNYMGDDNCVWDDNKPEDCSIASSGILKKDCEHWKRKKDIPIMYGSDDIWKWIERNIGAVK